ncbi:MULTISPECIES: hypothetical protein [unclassified Mesorhizobium]|uniref:hypothetical protein n=1 Tax=unclassified Mesorhizobium TaxID=325217 RepID=UPI003336B27F
MADDPEQIVQKILHGDRSEELASKLLGHLNRGFRPDVVRDLIRSRNGYANSVGVFVLEEMRTKPASLRDVALELNDSPIPRRRSVFLSFAMSMSSADSEVIAKIRDRLDDLNLHVRCVAIEWIILAPTRDTLSLCRICIEGFDGSIQEAIDKLASADQNNRILRALRIGLLIKVRHPHKEVFSEILREDSFTIEYFAYKKNHRRPVTFDPTRDLSKNQPN